jgi:uncharacterized Zn finger protein
VSPGRRPTTRRTFGKTWWGRAWIEALEQRARLDANRLPRGRTYARRGRVGPLMVERGSVGAAVHGSRITPYLVRVRVRTFSDEEWDRLLDAVSARAAHTAALLDGDLPPEVVADAAAAGVDLLPGAGELGPGCSCPDWADPCKHSAAVVYLVADVLDDDPFALLLLRGRTRDEVLAALRARRARPGGRSSSRDGATAADGRPADIGVSAREAYVGEAEPGAPLPPVPLPPRRPGDPAPLAVDPPRDSGLRSEDLTNLAADAARRSWELCLGEGDGGLELEPGLDLVRRVAGSLGGVGRLRIDEVASRAGVRPRELLRLAVAWRAGGADAVAVLDEVWSPDADALDEGRSVCAALGAVRVRGNRISLGRGDVQLRLGRAGSWYRFERVDRTWELIDGPAGDPADLVKPRTVPMGRA